MEWWKSRKAYVLYIDLVMSVISIWKRRKCIRSRSSLFWEVRQHSLVFSRRRFGKAYLYHHQGSKNSSWTAWALKMGPICLLATSLTTNQCRVTTEKSEVLDYTEAENLKSRLADLSFFILLFSNVLNSAVTHRHTSARPENKWVTFTRGDCRETDNKKIINLYASPNIAVIAESWGVSWLRKTIL